MNTVNIYLLLLGWVLYWLVKANGERQLNPNTFHIVSFCENNWLEIIISTVSCIILIVVNKPPDSSTYQGKIAIVTMGYMSTSLIKNLMPSLKPNHD
jgi:hypothetical protein